MKKQVVVPEIISFKLKCKIPLKTSVLLSNITFRKLYLKFSEETENDVKYNFFFFQENLKENKAGMIRKYCVE